MFKNTLFTSEAVSCGHPDKICDQISDAILDEFLRQDKESKVAVECFITNNLLVIGGEAHSHADVDVVGIAKKVISEIGYDGTNGFDPESAVFLNTLHEQSSDIRQGVDRAEEEKQGAGDQGIMFGYAIDETAQLMPVPIVLANTTMRVYDEIRKNYAFLNPDAKCQYTIKYDEYGSPLHVDTFLISMQHKEGTTLEQLYNFVKKELLPRVQDYVPEYSWLLEDDIRNIYINPTGKFVIGGPQGDTGLTGRKIIVDTYGGVCPHGGGAFSGKDASKVDRSAAYAARYVAKNIVAAGLATEACVQLSYGIGIAEPISIHVETNGYGAASEKGISNADIEEMIKQVFNLTPYGIITHLKLKKPIYKDTATYGHFGWEGYPWEKTDKVEAIRNYFGIKE